MQRTYREEYSSPQCKCHPSSQSYGDDPGSMPTLIFGRKEPYRTIVTPSIRTAANPGSADRAGLHKTESRFIGTSCDKPPITLYKWIPEIIRMKCDAGKSRFCLVVKGARISNANHKVGNLAPAVEMWRTSEIVSTDSPQELVTRNFSLINLKGSMGKTNEVIEICKSDTLTTTQKKLELTKLFLENTSRSIQKLVSHPSSQKNLYIEITQFYLSCIKVNGVDKERLVSVLNLLNSVTRGSELTSLPNQRVKTQTHSVVKNNRHQSESNYEKSDHFFHGNDNPGSSPLSAATESPSSKMSIETIAEPLSFISCAPRKSTLPPSRNLMSVESKKTHSMVADDIETSTIDSAKECDQSPMNTSFSLLMCSYARSNCLEYQADVIQKPNIATKSHHPRKSNDNVQCEILTKERNLETNATSHNRGNRKVIETLPSSQSREETSHIPKYGPEAFSNISGNSSGTINGPTHENVAKPFIDNRNNVTLSGGPSNPTTKKRQRKSRTVNRDDDGWTKQEISRLIEASTKFIPTSASFWGSVSECVASKNVTECVFKLKKINGEEIEQKLQRSQRRKRDVTGGKIDSKAVNNLPDELNKICRTDGPRRDMQVRNILKLRSQVDDKGRSPKNWLFKGNVSPSYSPPLIAKSKKEKLVPSRISDPFNKSCERGSIASGNSVKLTNTRCKAFLSAKDLLAEKLESSNPPTASILFQNLSTCGSPRVKSAYHSQESHGSLLESDNVDDDDLSCVLSGIYHQDDDSVKQTMRYHTFTRGVTGLMKSSRNQKLGDAKKIPNKTPTRGDAIRFLKRESTGKQPKVDNITCRGEMDEEFGCIVARHKYIEKKNYLNDIFQEVEMDDDGNIFSVDGNDCDIEDILQTSSP